MGNSESNYETEKQTNEISSWSIGNKNDVDTVKSKLHMWPLDEYNIKLLNEVHPKNWSNTKKEGGKEDGSSDSNSDVKTYDLIAIGAGAGGLVSSRQVRIIR